MCLHFVRIHHSARVAEFSSLVNNTHYFTFCHYDDRGLSADCRLCARVYVSGREVLEAWRLDCDGVGESVGVDGACYECARCSCLQWMGLRVLLVCAVLLKAKALSKSCLYQSYFTSTEPSGLIFML